MQTVNSILKRRGGFVWSVKPTDSVLIALTMMIEKDIGAVLVMEDEKICGIISERDIARKVIAHQLPADKISVQKIMTSTVHTIEHDATIETARALMTAHRIRHLPVMKEDKVIGVISNRDVVSEIIVIQRQTIDFYKDIALDE